MQETKNLLVLNVIGEHFGDIVKQVAKILTESDFCTFPSIVRQTQQSPTEPASKPVLNPTSIRKSLLTLYQHNLLIVELPPTSDPDEFSQLDLEARLKYVGLLYQLNIENTLHRLKIPKLLKLVGTQCGFDSLWVIESALVSGVSHFDELKNICLDNPPPVQIENFNNAETSEERFINAFETLTKKSFLVLAPNVEIKQRPIAPFEKTNGANSFSTFLENTARGIMPTSKNEKTSASEKNNLVTKKRPRAKASNEEQHFLPLEMRLLMENTEKNPKNISYSQYLGESENPVGSSENPGNDGEWMAEDENPKKKPVRRTAGPRGGRGRGRGRGRGGLISPLNSNSDIPNDVPNDVPNAKETGQAPVAIDYRAKGVRWNIGWEQVSKENYISSCGEAILRAQGLLASRIITVLLKSGQSLSVSEISAALKKAPDSTSNGENDEMGQDLSVDIGQLKKLLEFLRFSQGLVVKDLGPDRPGGPSYGVKGNTLLLLLTRNAVRQIATTRFSAGAGRVVELLLRKPFQQQQALSDLLVLPAREVRELIYKLYRDRWVNYRELSKRGDFNATSNFYFWFLNENHVKNVIKQHLLRTIYNLRLRLQYEEKEGKDILYNESLVALNQEKRKKLLLRVRRLNSAIEKTYSMFLLFEYK